MNIKEDIDNNFFIKLYYKIYKYRFLCIFITISFWIFAVFYSSHMKLDTSSLPFFPDKNAYARHIVEAIDILPTSRLLFIDISVDKPESRNELLSVANTILDELPPDLATPASLAMIKPQNLMSLLPYYTDTHVSQILCRYIESKKIEEYVISAKKNKQFCNNWTASRPVAV